MGCGSHSKVNTTTVEKLKTTKLQLSDIQQIIEQNLNDINYKNPQQLIEELEKDEGLKQNENNLKQDKMSTQSEGSSNSSPKVTQATISSKQDIFLSQAIAKHSDVFYTEILKKEVFKLSPDIKTPVTYSKFTSNVIQAKRVQSEIRILVKNLPIFSTNSIFVRCNEIDTNHFQCLIMGSKDTPYAFGAFIYDLYCDYNFPQSPPKMKLLTTGGGSVRFNPNLYSDGFICLSLLGTWSGVKSEKWHEQSSNIFQLLLSIQSLVMNEGVYYNEPSVGKKSAENETRNRGYKNIIKIGNIKHAMIDQLRNPDPAFRDIIRTHFYLNRNEILKQCDSWILDAKQSDQNNTKYDSFVRSHNTNQANRYKNNYSLYAKDLIDIVYELKQELQKIDLTTLPLYQEFLEKINSNEEKNNLVEEKQEVNSMINLVEVDPRDNVLNKLPHQNELIC